ncbi:MAG: DUF547 domain-containing protein [Hyphomicrobiaceae bacterium]|nr:DUF547 domain-containing protein [Hyphomicrobiaceae bacterium]
MQKLEQISSLMLTLVVSILALSAPAAAKSPRDIVSRHDRNSTVTVDHAGWDRLLSQFVKPGADGLNRVDYAAFKARGHDQLKTYLLSMGRIDPRVLNRNEQFAYLANLYNAKTIDIVLDHYPVRSIKDISLGGGLFAAFTGGPWKAKVVSINGVSLSLDDIEHEILRKVYWDPRVHYAVNCASIGCPNLGSRAFSGAKLDVLLESAARDFVNSPRGVRIQGDRVMVSSIYEWFKADFGGNDTGVLRHLMKYAEPLLAAKLKSIGAIANHDYDWRLNDIKTAGGL